MIIPYEQLEAARRYNEKIRGSGDETERRIYRAAKEYALHLPYERLEELMARMRKELED